MTVTVFGPLISRDGHARQNYAHQSEPERVGPWPTERGRPSCGPLRRSAHVVSLLINEGLTPMLVAQRTGHSLDELWKTYAHLFESADELNRVPLGDALGAARASIAARRVHGEFTAADSSPSRLTR